MELIKQISEFSGEYRWLSNFAECRIILGNTTYSSVEHAYQSMKSDDPEWRKFCADPSNSAGTIKRKSRDVTIIPRWDDLKELVMYICLFQKYLQEPYLTALVETGDSLIIEGNTWGDTFWGVCDGKGQNRLGELIMKIRDKVKHIKKPVDKQ